MPPCGIRPVLEVGAVGRADHHEAVELVVKPI